MGSDFDAEWYNLCLEVCELTQDLQILPLGDNLGKIMKSFRQLIYSIIFQSCWN